MPATAEVKATSVLPGMLTPVDETLAWAMEQVRQVLSTARSAAPLCARCNSEMRQEQDRILYTEVYATLGEQVWRCHRCGETTEVPYRAYFVFR